MTKIVNWIVALIISLQTGLAYVPAPVKQFQPDVYFSPNSAGRPDYKEMYKQMHDIALIEQKPSKLRTIPIPDGYRKLKVDSPGKIYWPFAVSNTDAGDATKYLSKASDSIDKLERLPIGYFTTIEDINKHSTININWIGDINTDNKTSGEVTQYLYVWKLHRDTPIIMPGDGVIDEKYEYIERYYPKANAFNEGLSLRFFTSSSASNRKHRVTFYSMEKLWMDWDKEFPDAKQADRALYIPTIKLEKDFKLNGGKILGKAGVTGAGDMFLKDQNEYVYLLATFEATSLTDPGVYTYLTIEDYFAEIAGFAELTDKGSGSFKVEHLHDKLKLVPVSE